MHSEGRKNLRARTVEGQSGTVFDGRSKINHRTSVQLVGAQHGIRAREADRQVVGGEVPDVGDGRSVDRHAAGTRRIEPERRVGRGLRGRLQVADIQPVETGLQNAGESSAVKHTQRGRAFATRSARTLQRSEHNVAGAGAGIQHRAIRERDAPQVAEPFGREQRLHIHALLLGQRVVEEHHLAEALPAALHCGHPVTAKLVGGSVGGSDKLHQLVTAVQHASLPIGIQLETVNKNPSVFDARGGVAIEKSGLRAVAPCGSPTVKVDATGMAEQKAAAVLAAEQPEGRADIGDLRVPREVAFGDMAGSRVGRRGRASVTVVVEVNHRTTAERVEQQVRRVIDQIVGGGGPAAVEADVGPVGDVAVLVGHDRAVVGAGIHMEDRIQRIGAIGPRKGQTASLNIKPAGQ